MSFHLGKPILVMLIVALLSGVYVIQRGGQRDAEVRIWVFADSHYRSFQPLVRNWENEHDLTVNLNLLNIRAMNTRLMSLFMTDPDSDVTPDLVEIEIGFIGRYFRPPLEDVGLVPLNEFLEKSGLRHRILDQRFSPWTKQGVIFGIPHDVHPVTISYRHDLFWGEEDANGNFIGPLIDLLQAKTWPEFHEKCVRFESYWQSRGHKYRHAVELPEAAVDYIIVMLLQRGINLVDDYNRIHLADPKVAHTVAFYAQLVAGSRAVAAQSTGGMGSFVKDLNDGNICAFITPDWRITYIRRYSPSLAGKMRMMPLPIFDPGDSPTSTWGGTCIAITKACRDPRRAWELIEYLYFSEDGLKSRRQHTAIIPPLIETWDDPAYHQPDPYFGGQMANELFIELARQLPRRYVTPATGLANAELTLVLTRAVTHVRLFGGDGLEEKCQAWLNEAAVNLQKRMDHWRFDE